MSAQAQLYWDQDATTPPTTLAAGNYTTDPTGLDPTQEATYLPGYDIVFSAANGVGTEAQTINMGAERVEYNVLGLYFDKGAITLQDDGHGNSTLDLGTDGITVDATVNGTTTVAPATLNFLGSQEWDNDSSQELIVGGDVQSQNQGYVLTNNGNGTGAVDVTGFFGTQIAIDQESSSSALDLTNTNNSGISSLNINKGTVVATDLGAIAENNGAYVIQIQNGGTLTFQNAITMSAPLNVTGGGVLNFTGETDLYWASGAVTADTLTFGTGDLTDSGIYNPNGPWIAESQNIQTLNLGVGADVGRLIVGANGQGYAFLSGIQQINVNSGYVLDFGGTYDNNPTPFNATVTNAINLASGGGIESRNSGTVTLTDVTLPTSGSLILGADEQGQFGSIVITANDTLSGTLTIGASRPGYGTTDGILSGDISGTGGLVVTGVSLLNYNFETAENIWLKGTNTYSGSTYVEVGLAPYVVNYAGSDQAALVIAGDNSGTGSDYELQGGWLYVDPAGKLPTTAIVTLSGLGFDPTNNNYVGAQSNFLIGDANGATTVTIAGLASGGPIDNDSGDFRGAFVGNGYSGGTSTLILNSVAGQVFDYQGGIGDGYADAYGTYNGGSENGFGYSGQYFFNNLKVVKTGAGTQELTNQNNDFNGGVEIDGGVLAVVGGNSFYNTTNNSLGFNTTSADSTHVIIGSALGTGTVTINNGATLDVLPNTSALANIITLGTAGTVTYDGDSWQAAGTIAGYDPANPTVQTDYDFTGNFVGGGGLVVGFGDLLANTTVAGTPGNIYILDGRLLMQSNGTTFIQNAPSVTVADGGILDFGAGGTESTPGNQPIYVGANGWINERSTNVTINDLVPIVGTSGNAPSLVIGTDDYAGTDGSITVANQVNLTSNFTILSEEGNQNNFEYSAVAFTGGFTGEGNLTFGSLYQTGYPLNTFNRGFITVSGPNSYKGDTTVNSGILYLAGDNSAVTSTTGGAPNYRISATIPAPGVNLPGVLQIAPTATLASDANIILGGSTANTFGYFVLGDSTGAANVTVGSITADVGSGDIMNGDDSDGNYSTLTVDVAANKTDTYTGTIGYDPNNYNFGNQTTGGAVSKYAQDISLVKSGAGTLTLSGQNYYSGTTTVNGGKLNINSTLNSGVTVNAGGAIGGSGTINGTISGAGAVKLGDPTILTASSVDPSSGMSFNFEFTLTGQPLYNSPTASGNDILHLESTSPFIASITSSNVINFYVAGNGIFDGGIFVNGDNDILTPYLSNATFDIYILNNMGGTVSYDGNRYSLVSDLGGTAIENTFQVDGANFGDGTTDGYEEQITVSGAVIPEPSTDAMLLMGVGLIGFCLRRKLA